MFRLLLVLPLAACMAAPPDLPAFMAARIETGPDGRCYGRDITPAVIETVREQVREPGEGPARYRSVTRQSILRERRAVLFETLCPPAFTPAFVETLQRALVTRGFHPGPVTGQLDTVTLDAVQTFQRSSGGPDSPVLSLASAQRLGITALTPAQLDLMNRR
ncbi:peptidoglycan-binding domain-containing protein [Limimaricola hongkongensis]|uniref:Lipoprotein, putative n=1 Tax=Limimaricola hongkongensis DSM 17492 TaxID=1122180 RepID=A0A017HA05_9RHOB|nr:peptidoglycan-binding domain-containing protein [Limimaricola hongkongensis]EYD70978.1 lipoprotein, putative [Limimaricola hongkongensis DSM 17492]